jgi:uncharacterized repeat protein (TIGR01451 family)/CSLREA domain-containing protein
MLRRLLVSLGCTLLGIALAATITVNTTADELDLIPNGKCSLREAVISANENRDVGGCTGVGAYGADAITLPAGVYRLTRTIGLLDQDRGDLNIRGTLTISGVAASGTIIDGGGIDTVVRVEEVPATLKRLTVRNGKTEYWGGGISSSGTLTLEDVEISGNQAFGCGGGVHSTDHVYRSGLYFPTSGSLTLIRTTVAGNQVGNSGGGLCIESPAVIEASTVSGNFAGSYEGELVYSGDGGGMIIRPHAAATVRITNNTISGNGSIFEGGGLSTSSGSRSNQATILLSNVTITNNSATRGGGLYSTIAASAFRLENTLIAGNRGVETGAPDCVGAFDSRGHNLVGSSRGCTGFTAASDQVGSEAQPIDPRLGPLADNGGPTRTHALLAGSPAIDRGGACGSADQRGQSRPTDGDGDGFSFCDMGAYEAPQLAPRADLALDISKDRSRIVAGAGFAYVLRVTNNGPATASATAVSLDIPGFALRYTTGCTLTAVSAPITCALGSLARGATRTLNVFMTAPAEPGTYVAFGTVSSATQDPTRSNDTAREVTRVVAPSADLAVSLSAAPSPATVGVTLTFTATVTNTGPDEAQGVRVSLALPASLTVVSAPGCTPIGAALNCSLGSVPSSGKTLQFTARPTAAGNLLAVATVTSDTADPSGTNNSAALTTVARPAPEADVKVLIVAPTSAQTGTPFTYTLSVTNAGPSQAENVVLHHPLPDGVTLGSAPGCSPQTGTIRCALGTLALGEERRLSVSVRAPAAPTQLRARASVTSEMTDPLPGNNGAEALIPVIADPPPAGGDLALVKQAPSAAEVGSSLRYSLVVVNHGPETATSVAVTDTLPSGVVFASASEGCAHDAGTVRCILGTMGPGVSVGVTLTVTMSAAPGVLVNRATVTSDNDSNLANNEATAETAVIAQEQQADLLILKAAARREVAPGAALAYALEVANLGPAAAVGVTVTDTLPAGADLVRLPSDCTRSERTVTCALGNLPMGETRRLSLDVRAPTALGTFVNEAEVSSFAVDPTPANNRAAAEAVVVPSEDAAPPTLTVTRGPRSPGDQSARLDGPIPALQVAVTTGPLEAVSLTAATVAVAASGARGAAPAIKLYADANGDGLLDAGDTLLASGTAGASGEALLTLASPYALAPEATAHWLVTLGGDAAPVGGLLFPFALLGLAVLCRRRYLALGLLVLIASCAQPRQTPPEAPHYTVTLTAMAAVGETSGQAVTPTGLPVAGGTLTVTP